MSKKTDNLQWQIDRLTNRVMCLEDRIYAMERKWEEFDKRVVAVMQDKTQVMVVDSLAAYQKGKKIKKEIDYISEVLGDK
jgi:hypothetical protein